MKIGITERGDAGIDFGWVEKVPSMDGAILITKNITKKFISSVMQPAIKDKVIVHATCTGYGETVLEPNVPPAFAQLRSAVQLTQAGFSKEKIVIRVDPIIPTENGISLAVTIIGNAYQMGFNRFRISVIDMYKHVRERFIKAGILLPYSTNKNSDRDFFSPYKAEERASESQFNAVNEMIKALKAQYPNIRIECCAEPLLTEALYSGCVSEYDLDLLGLKMSEKDWDNPSFQRKGCLCIPGKIELLTRKTQCPHQCLYCYWQD